MVVGILNGPVHSLRFEFSPGVRYDEYTDGDTDTQPLGYASGYLGLADDRLTPNLRKGVSVFRRRGHHGQLRGALNVAINAHFALKVAYNVTTGTLSRLRPRRSIPIAGPRSP